MKAFTKYRYGGPEVLHLEEIELPELKEHHILIKIKANSANPADWHIIRGKPLFARFSFGLFRPKDKVPGADFAGIVEKTGSAVTRFKPGDKVFGETLQGGAFATYHSVTESVCALMPANEDFTSMACLPIAGLTALQAITTHGRLQAGQSVLINGASGGVGHFAVQIAKAYGARVTGVCSSKNIDFVKNLGADEVIAYDKENIHVHQGKYDLVIDANGNLDFKDYTRMGRRGVMIGFTTLAQMASVLLRKAISSYPLVQFTAAANPRDLETLATLVENHKLKPYIEKTYSYKNIPEAIGYIEAMHTRGKVAMSWEEG